MNPDYERQRQIISEAAAIRYKKMIHRTLAKRKFIRFCQWMDDAWITARHHQEIAERLDAVLSGQLTRLQISMPPRHGKSRMSSELFPAFWLGHHPEKQIIHVSHSASLSNEFSRKVRSMIRDDVNYKRLFPTLALDPDRQRLDDWRTTAGGGFMSIGVQGGITGRGADLLIIDDPVKEGDERSMNTLEATYEWYLSAARTRLSPGAAVILIMTRWHPHDLAGKLLHLARKDPNADQWEALVLPAIAEEDDPIHRQPGEALWPERFSVTDLKAIQRLSERYFGALFQQRPTVSETPMFLEEDFRRFKAERQRKAEGDSEVVWGIDLAASEKERSDYNVFARAIRRNGELRVYDVQRFRAEWPETKKTLSTLVRKNPDHHFAFPTHSLELLAVQELLAQFPDRAAHFHKVTLPGDKVERAQSAADLARNGLFAVCESEAGDLFVEEHAGFPETAQHDDCVDASSVLTHYFGFKTAFELIRSQHEPETDAQAQLVSQLMQSVGAM